METKYYTKQNLVTIFIAGILIGLGLYYLWDNAGVLGVKNTNTKKSVSIDSAKDVVVNEATFRQSDNTIVANDQLAGLRVDVGPFSIAKDGWVVVHEDNNGKPGNILGAQRYDAGVYDSGEVSLLRNTEEGKVYYVMLHTDDGNREFSYELDTPVLNGRGIPVMAVFNAIRVR